MACDCRPALAVDAAVAEHLEVLCLTALAEESPSSNEYTMLTPAIGSLGDAVDGLRLRQSGRFEDGGGDVDHVVELRAHLAARCDAARPKWMMVPLRVPPQCEATCFVHW